MSGLFVSIAVFCLKLKKILLLQGRVHVQDFSVKSAAKHRKATVFCTRIQFANPFASCGRCGEMSLDGSDFYVVGPTTRGPISPSSLTVC